MPCLKSPCSIAPYWLLSPPEKHSWVGFTTIRDLETEGAWYGDAALRDAINDGVVIGPRMQCATRALSVTGGYTPYGYSPDVDIPRGAQIVDGVDGVRKAVREQLANGADVIKIYADHRRRGASNPDMLTAFPTFSFDETKAIVEEAAKVGAKVAAHVYHSASAQTAIRAGVASLEHGMYLDDPTFEMMAKGSVLGAHAHGLLAGAGRSHPSYGRTTAVDDRNN